MGHFLSAVILVVFIMLFTGDLMMFYTLHACVCVLTQLHTGVCCLCVSQLFVQRSASMVAVCLLIPACVSPDGADWTALVVSALYSQTPH